MSVPVPQPPGLPLVGNAYDIDPKNSVLSLLHLSKKYGEIFKLNLGGTDFYIISTVELLSEICDEKRFHKSHSAALVQVRNGVGDGLFSAYHDEHNWGVAHRALLPAFGPIGIHAMYDEMYDIATQLVAKWARLGEGESINVTEDYTRLALDSIALCAMDKRFNSFYTEQVNPFVEAMTGFLVESGLRATRTSLEQLWNTKATRQYQADIALMLKVAKEVVDHRRSNPSPKKDLLNAMLFGKDPKTGEKLTDQSIMNNMITFLIAGHETTSGMLSFASYNLIKNPEAFRKAQAEVDAVVGKGPVKVEHISKLPYLEAVLRETLRLTPTATQFSVKPWEDSTGPIVLAGKYHISPGGVITALLPAIGRDASVYGTDADEFKPERMYGENFAKLPPNAFKPFGNGARACIGRPFAWQEGLLALALILQNFNLRLADPSYELRIKQTLTIKPDGLLMKATLRDGIDPIYLEKKMFSGLSDESKKVNGTTTAAEVATGPQKPMTILYGSNSGTCEGLSQVLARNAASHGFDATVKTMDAAVDQLSLDQPLVVITSSYEGQPPDNAGAFCEWLKSGPQDLKGLKYAVFGCGHRDWVNTYQKMSKFVDSQLESLGAARITTRGESNVAAGTIFDDFDQWQDTALWQQLGDKESAQGESGIDVDITTDSRASHFNHQVQDALVMGNDLLTASGVPEKKHMQLQLPSGLTYEAGDYMAFLPLNDFMTVTRILRRFSIPWDAVMTVKKGSHSTIPANQPMQVSVVLAAYVELNVAATKKNLSIIASFAPDDTTKDRLVQDPAPNAGPTPSVLDVLEAYPEVQLPFGVFLSMLTPMRIRQYSISSSPLHDPTKATITYAVAGQDLQHPGVASNYLKTLQPGMKLQVMVKKPKAPFRLPVDDKVPVIMFCAGTGLAPFRGFVQERVARLEAGSGTTLGEAVLFVGCRHPDSDRLFPEEFDRAEKLGAVKVYYAYSKAADQSEGCKYVQDRLWHERAEASRLFRAGAQAYICGSAAVGKGISDTAARIHVEDCSRRGETMTHEEALKWWEALRGERFAMDVFD